MEPENDPVLEFWNQSDARKDQMLYTAFSLIEVGVLNYALGKFLGRRKTYDWASTALYYSLIYQARLIVFLGLGDFPTGHAQIGRLFGLGESHGRAWFRSRKSSIPELSSLQSVEYTFRLNSVKMKLLNRGVSEQAVNECCAFFGHLEDATRLRNDSSYESLLVAHEYNHKLVTETFQDLWMCLTRLSRRGNEICIRLFRELIAAHERRRYFCAFLGDEENRDGLYYLEDHVRDRFPANQRDPSDEKLVMDSLALVIPLKEIAKANQGDSELFLNNVSLEVFDSKKDLMKDFRERVKSLSLLS